MNAKSRSSPSKFSVARNVKKLREHHGWSQAALAKKAGVSQSTVSNMEVPERATPRYSPTMDNVDAVATVFGLPAAVLAMDLPIDVLLDYSKIAMVIHGYAESRVEGRKAIEVVAELSRPRYLPSPADVVTGVNKQP